MELDRVTTQDSNDKSAIIARLHEILDDDVPFREITIPVLMDGLPGSEETFFRYFNNVSEVLMPLILEMQRNTKQVSKAWYTDDGRPVAMRLEESVRSRVDFIQPYGRVLRAIVDASSQDGTINQMWSHLLKYYISDARNNIESQQAAGLIRKELDAANVAIYLSYGNIQLYLLHFGGTEQSPKERAIDTLMQVWRAVLYLE